MYCEYNLARYESDMGFTCTFLKLKTAKKYRFAMIHTEELQ